MDRVGLDKLPPVTEDEALEICVHHLQLAAIYAQNVSEDLPAVLAEAERIVCRDAPTYVKGNPFWEGARAFLEASHEAHEALKEKFGQ